MIKRVSILLVIFVLLASPVFAMGGNDCMGKCMGKLGYGLTNLLLGWTEIFQEPYNAAKSGGNVVTGIGKGLWNAVGDTVGGVLHTVTFFIPQLDVPLPEGGTDILK